MIKTLHDAFSDFKFYVLKSVAEDDGGENIIASRVEFTGTISLLTYFSVMVLM